MVLLYRMKSFIEIYRLAFTYKVQAILTIVFNLLYVIFNLLSLVLFIPFLQLIFPKSDEDIIILEKPVFEGGISQFVSYCSDFYNYSMQQLVMEDPKKALLIVCISVLAAFFFKNVFRYFAIYHQSFIRMAVVRDVRNTLFNKAMVLPISFYTEEKKGDIMARMNNDVNEIEIAVVAVLELIYREPIAILMNIAVLMYWSPQLTLISFVLLPISALVISRIGKSLKRTAKQGQEQMSLLFSAMDESLWGIRIIKAFNAGEFIANNFKKVNLRHQQLVTKTFRKRDLSSPLNEFLGAAVMLGIVWFGGKMILDAKQDSGLDGETFITFIIVFSQLLRPIQGVATNIGFLNKARVSQDRINEILDTDERIVTPDNPVQFKPLSKGISYEGVFFKYRDKNVIHDLNLFIPKGKVIAIVGESGSGKSTLMDLLPRFYDVTGGAIKIDDVNVKDYSLFDLRDQIGIVSQESILFNDSIRNNIAFGLSDVSEEQIIEAAKVANAHEFILKLEEGYDTNIGERGNKLSGGQKQRISIARAILKNPAILILDEATSALDTESEKLVQTALDSLMENRTAIVIAHRLSTVKNADKIVVLSNGVIVEEGSHDELIALKGSYYRLTTMQGSLA